MFGYVRPLRDELKVGSFESYKALYCGLCHTITSRHGRLARFFLNYDFTFLAMLFSQGGRPAVGRRRCAASPFRGKPACAVDPALEIAADETVILAYWKLRDTIDDSSFWRGLIFRVPALLLRPAYAKAAQFRPDFDLRVRACLRELAEMEAEQCPSIDRPADTFARILQAAAPVTGDSRRDRPMAQLLYHVGRWIYLVDAWDDMDEDRAAGRYNPILTRFGGEEAARETLRTTLLHSRNLAVSAYSLLEPGCWGEIIDNILYLGLPTAEELVFAGQWKKPGGRFRSAETKIGEFTHE